MAKNPKDQDIDQQLIQAFVLLQRQFLLTELVVKNGTAALAEFEISISSNSQRIEHVFSVFNYALALVDHLVRYRKIASAIPRISQKSNEFRALEKALNPLTNVRNQFQHINNHIANNNSGPLLGTVSWTSNKNQFIASFNDIGKQNTVPGIWIDTKTGNFGFTFCYIYNESYYDLEKAINGMRGFQTYINSICDVKIDGKDFIQEEHFTAMKIEFKLTPIANDK
jgi:hypothetical protein